NRVLKMMNRNYTREQYLEKVDKLRKHCPDIAITSDIIVGFPGETISDFEETLDLIKRIEYDSLFAFKYSDRPNVSATGFADKIPEADKKERLQKILELQDHYTVKKNRSFLGSLELLLVEGLSKKHSSGMRQPVSILKDVRCREVQWTGRTSTNKIVNFIWESDAYYCNNSLTGKMVEVRIEKAFSHSLWGKVNKIKIEPLGLKGEESYAA
ncbi:MAG: radical SAM protein, partial [Deltaproteobacteria bacterium]|nr:radical SAM protein [Deltaproteobacteria bacterium]